MVELGGGTGSVTKHILSVLGDNDQLFCIELNQVFIDHLSKKINDHRLKLINGSAEQILDHLKSIDIDGVDCIVSSLPLSNMPTTTKSKILAGCQQALNPSGQFIQFQYTLQDKKFVQRYFSVCKLGFVLINIPPAFIYSCRN